MKLDDSQMKQVAKWFAAGERLSDIQRRIAEEFGVEMTYLDVRLLVADLPQPEEAAPSPDVAAVSSPSSEPDDVAAASSPSPEPYVAASSSDVAAASSPSPDDAASSPSQTVSVSMSPIAIPGTIASGSVVFSDGKSGKWYLDEMGRLGLADLPEGYRPPPSDGADFQRQIVSLLRSKGMM